MAILEGGHIVPPRTQATSRSPAPLGLIFTVAYNQEKTSSQTISQIVELNCYMTKEGLT